MMTPEEAYREAKRSGWSQELEDIVADSRNPEWAYMFAKINGANIPKLQQIVIRASDPEFAYYFAKNIPGADIGKLEQVVIDSKNPTWLSEFAAQVRGANVSKLEQAVIDSGSILGLYSLALHAEGANIPKLEQAVVDSQDAEIAYNFARYIRGANIPKLQQVVIDAGEPEWAYEFARYVKKANISKLKRVVANSGDPKLIYKFARDVGGGKKAKVETVTLGELESVFKYFHLSSEKLNMKSDKFTFTPRIPKEPLPAEDNFTPRVSLGKTITKCVEALGVRDDYYVYAVDLKDKSEDDVNLFSTKERITTCPSGPEHNNYGTGFKIDAYIKYKYGKDMKKLGFDPSSKNHIDLFKKMKSTKEELFGTGTEVPKEFKGCVPDAENTDEMWSTENITMYYIGQMFDDTVVLSETGKEIMRKYAEDKEKLRNEIRKQIGGILR